MQEKKKKKTYLSEIIVIHYFLFYIFGRFFILKFQIEKKRDIERVWIALYFKNE